MLSIVAFAFVLVVVSFGFHFLVLQALSATVPAMRVRLQLRVLVVITVAFAAHIVEAIIYGVAFLLAESLSLGTLSGATDGALMDYLYYSLVSYTSLGIGDVSPTGHLRFLTGVEALNGLLLIAWSGSYTYLAMGQLWPMHQCR